MSRGIKFIQVSDRSWTDEAACKGMQAIFFGPGYGVSEKVADKKARINKCKEVCRTCPVFFACEQSSLTTIGNTNKLVHPYGYMAGRTERERKQEVQQRRIKGLLAP